MTTALVRIALLGIVGLSCQAFAQAGKAVAVADAAEADKALSAGREVLKRDAFLALPSLRLAVRLDGLRAEALYLLGKAYQVAGRSQATAESFRKLLELPDQPGRGPAELEKWKEEARTRLKALADAQAGWDELRKQFAPRYQAVGAGGANLPSGLAGLTIAAALAPEDRALADQLKAAQTHFNDVVPPPADKTALRTSPGVLVSRAKPPSEKKRIELLIIAWSLDPDPQALVDIAELLAESGEDVRAAFAAAQAREKLATADRWSQGKLAPRILPLLQRLDRNQANLATLSDQFAPQAEALAARLLAAKDFDGCHQVLQVGMLATPDRKAMRNLHGECADARLLSGAFPAMDDPDIYTGVFNGAQCNRTAECIEFAAQPSVGFGPGRLVDPVGPQANKQPQPQLNIGFGGRLTWGKYIRLTCRLEELTVPLDTAHMNLVVWPVNKQGGEVSLDLSPHRAKLNANNVLVVKKAEQAPISADTAYEITLEKDGGGLVVEVNGVRMLECKLPLNEVQGRPVDLVIEGPMNSHVKLRVIDFVCSGDSIRPRKPIK